VCSARDFRQAFFPRSASACSRRPLLIAVRLTAIGMTHHAYTDRERHGGRERGGLTAAETVSDCGVLWVS